MTSAKQDNLKIEFGTDGIRAIAGQFPLDSLTVQKIGRAIGRWLKSKWSNPQFTPFVIIGRDTRISGDMLQHALTTGLLAEGINVWDAEITTTPEIAYYVSAYSPQLGIVISASHNPYQQNGIKIFGADGFKLSDDDEIAIANLINTLDDSASTAMGRAQKWPNHTYVRDLVTPYYASGLETLKIVMDCANGASYKAAPLAFQSLWRRGHTPHLILMNFQPDGENINVNAGSEFVRRDREAMLKQIRENNADLGIAFDGDADRVVFVTPEGMLVDGDHIMGILAVEFKEHGRLTGDVVVATDMSNSGLEHFLAEHGIVLSRTKVGDRYVMERLREKGYRLGGEQAGHVIVLDEEHTCGDGIYVALMIADLVARNKRNGGPTLHELATKIPRYPQVIASAHLANRTDLKQVDGLAELEQAMLRKFEGKGRINMRFSGTEPNLLRVMVEGGPATTLKEVVDCALALVAPVSQATHSDRPHIDIVDCVTGAPVQL